MTEREIHTRPGTTITEFHYGGQTVQLDPQWAVSYYEKRIEQFLDEYRMGGAPWGWFWVDQRAGVSFRFRLGDGIGYAFTVRDYEQALGFGGGSEHPNQIDDLRIGN